MVVWELIQLGLISKIISLAGLEDESNERHTPATTILHADPSGPNREHTWNNRTILSMLTYLSTSTHLDIAFAAHQCTCFSTNPKQIHEIAVHCIICYLRGTRDKGYTLKPSMSRTLDCYVDADFAGLWHPSIAALLMIPYPSNLIQVTLSPLLTVLSCGPLNYRQKLPSAPPRLNT